MIPMLDLKVQYESLKAEIDEAIRTIVDSTQFILGPEVTAFEKEMAAYLGVKFAIGVSSGTSALEIGLLAASVQKGDEVITTPFTFIATSEAAMNIGAKPVFVDIDPKTFNINPELIEKKITRKTKALLPVHLYGYPAEMDQIMNIAKKHNLIVLEDCAQALGGKYKGKRVGSIGDTAALSFFPSKNLGCFGDGGMVVTSNEAIAEKAKMLRQHGSKKRYIHEIDGYNARLDSIQAAILRVKLRHLDEWNEKRHEVASYFNKLLSEKGITVPILDNSEMQHSCNYYTIRVKHRDKMQEKLKEKGIASMIYYPISLHLQKVYEGLGYKKGDFPESEKAQDEVLSLPIYPELTRHQIEEIVRVLTE